MFYLSAVNYVQGRPFLLVCNFFTGRTDEDFWYFLMKNAFGAEAYIFRSHTRPAYFSLLNFIPAIFGTQSEELGARHGFVLMIVLGHGNLRPAGYQFCLGV